MAYNLYQSVCNLGCEYLQLLSAKTIHSVRILHPLYPGPPKPNGLNPVRCYETQKKHCAKGNEPKYTHICISGWIKSISLTWTQLLSYGQLWGWFPLWTMHANMCTYIYIYTIYISIYISPLDAFPLVKFQFLMVVLSWIQYLYLYYGYSDIYRYIYD